MSVPLIRNESTTLNNLSIGFDFDQTLADSSEGIMNCLEFVCLAFARDVSRNKLTQLSLSGRPLGETLSEIVSASEMDSAKAVFLEKYPTIGVQGTKLFSGVRELFELLRLEDCKIYILSAKTHDNLILSINNLQLQVDNAVGGLDFSGKVSFINEFELDFYVGDQISDMAAASEAQSRGILVNNSSIEKLPDGVYARFKNINDLLCNIRSILKI